MYNLYNLPWGNTNEGGLGTSRSLQRGQTLRESWSLGKLSYRKDGVPVVGEFLSETRQGRTIRYLTTMHNAFPWTHSQISCCRTSLSKRAPLKQLRSEGEVASLLGTTSDTGGTSANGMQNANRSIAEACPLCGDPNDGIQHSSGIFKLGFARTSKTMLG